MVDVKKNRRDSIEKMTVIVACWASWLRCSVKSRKQEEFYSGSIVQERVIKLSVVFKNSKKRCRFFDEVNEKVTDSEDLSCSGLTFSFWIVQPFLTVDIEIANDDELSRWIVWYDIFNCKKQWPEELLIIAFISLTVSATN